MNRWARVTVLAAAVVTLLLSLLDTNIVAAAAPSIGRAFGAGSVARIPWLVTAYALAETVTQPLYGKLADRHGVRPVLLLAVGVFTIGSVLCGFAPTMTALVVLRVVQGLGAAGLLSVTFVLLGHLRSAAEEDDAGAGNAAGGVLLAVGIVAGPLAGGTIVSHVSWRWVFLVNVPVGVVVFVVMAVALRLPRVTRDAVVDWRAAGWLAGAAIALQVAGVVGGHAVGWTSWPVFLLLVTGVACTVAFVRRQRSSSAPFVPPHLLHHPVLRRLLVLQVAAGTGLAAAFYVTVDLQLVRGETPWRAGLQLVAMAVGVVVGAVAGWALVRRGRPLRTSLVVGTLASAAALAALVLCSPRTPIEVVWVVLAVNGFGSGISLGNELTIVQDTVAEDELGIATSGVRFVETLGTTVGSTVFGVVFAHVASPATPGRVEQAVAVVFAAGAACLAVAVVAALRLPRDGQTGQTDSLAPVRSNRAAFDDWV